MRASRSIRSWPTKRADTRSSRRSSSRSSRAKRPARGEEQSGRELPVAVHPAGVPDSLDEHVKLMSDLQVLAWQADLTRVITFMLGREFSGVTFPQIGVPDAHHPITHHQREPEKIV